MRSLSLVVAAAALTLSSSALAYDSIACGPPDVRSDCEGLEAARTPWFSSEHALIWKRTRVLAGLPAAVDEPFTVETATLGVPADDDWQSLLPAPLDLAERIEPRQLEIAVFAQLPDKSYALWDWTSGNEGCPPLGTDDITTCHEFTGHMGWLNSNHFLPQAEQAFQHHHTLALERASECAGMADRLDDVDGAAEILEACDREALILEAIAQHYLQDAWSMGHMWERWGSPNAADFADAVQSNPDLYSLKAVGDAVGRASGIIHGAKAITGVSDAMCSPDPGVAFSYGDELLAGAGDLFLDRVNGDETLSAQRELLYGCAATAMRDVYVAGAQAFGDLSPSDTSRVDLVDCFPQRATNRAIALGSAIQVPLEVGGFEDIYATTSEAFLANLGLTPELASQDSLYLPLTSTVLSKVDIFGARLIDAAIVDRWNEDMAGIQDFLQFGARTDPFGTTLAQGALGTLLSMSPNAAYSGVADYTDPPLPWVPEPLLVPSEPRVENAGNIMSRTFVDAHAQDWCDVLHEDGDDEFALKALRDRCIATTAV